MKILLNLLKKIAEGRFKKFFSKTTCKGKQFPLKFNYNGNDFFMYYDKSAEYHIKTSTPKLQKLVNTLPEETNIILDVGAHSGIFSKMCGLKFPNAQIYAFEPNIDMMPALKANSSKNITLIPKAVGEFTSRNDFFVNNNSSQTSSCLFESVEIVSSGETPTRREVDVISLDEFFVNKDLNNKTVVLKIDVQGYEDYVIKGAKEIIKKVKILLLEASFLDKTSVELIFSLKPNFKFAYAINDVYLGADILLTSEHEIERDRYISQIW